MKKILHTILFLLPLMAIAQTNFYVYKTDGTVETYAVSDVEKISFTAPEGPEEPVVTTKVLTFEDSIFIGLLRCKCRKMVRFDSCC